VVLANVHINQTVNILPEAKASVASPQNSSEKMVSTPPTAFVVPANQFQPNMQMSLNGSQTTPPQTGAGMVVLY
jgi:hypothetical protein